MNICVYGAANDSIDKRYIAEGEKLGSLMAAAGHTLVFGAGKTGMMGAVARGVIQGKGTAIGVAPKFFDKPGVLCENLTEMIFTDTMRERKGIMEEKSDAFIMSPGGLGTMEEFFEILTLRQLSRHQKPVIILNLLGYYDPLVALIEHAIKEGFAAGENRSLFAVANTAQEAMEILVNNES